MWMKYLGQNGIYVGKVIQPLNVVEYQHDFPEYNAVAGDKQIVRYKVLRSMLYRKIGQGLANDLLYESPNYSILSNDLFIEERVPFGVIDEYPLEWSLYFSGFADKFRGKDMWAIRKRLLNGELLKRKKLLGLMKRVPSLPRKELEVLDMYGSYGFQPHAEEGRIRKIKY